MRKSNPTRRDFHQLALAALGGAVAGSVLGCSSEAPQGEAPKGEAAKGVAVVPGVTSGGEAETEVPGDEPDLKLLLAEKHICRGLNTCKGKGGCGETKGTNDCAGLGNCATAAHHDCGSSHDCKGQSGCGDTAGINACKGLGGCGVPLHEGSAWDTARAHLEELMKAEGKTLGPAPTKIE